MPNVQDHFALGRWIIQVTHGYVQKSKADRQALLTSVEQGTGLELDGLLIRLRNQSSDLVRGRAEVVWLCGKLKWGDGRRSIWRPNNEQWASGLDLSRTVQIFRYCRIGTHTSLTHRRKSDRSHMIEVGGTELESRRSTEAAWIQGSWKTGFRNSAWITTVDVENVSVASLVFQNMDKNRAAMKDFLSTHWCGHR